VTEGDKVASRWVATGHNRGRPITTWGVVISTIEDAEIIEDWAASDSLEIVRQLGIRRTLLLAVDYIRRR
jgi:predicted ester cyclase